ncbi:MAG: LysE family translocator [Candidatus Kapaibacterium sp.]
MLEFLVGFCTGFVLTIPPGPVAAFAIETSLHHGQRSGRGVAFGVALVDTVFCLGVLFASSALVQWGIGMAERNVMLSRILMTAVVLGILVVGIRQIVRPSTTVGSTRVHLESHVPGSRPFLVGAATALSNGFNPTFLSSLTAVIASIHTSFPVVTGSGVQRVLFAGGFGVGTYVWIHVITRVVLKHREAMSPAMLGLIRRIGGVIFTLFALFLLWKMYR